MLVASLVLNLFLIAVIGGHVLRSRFGEMEAGPPTLARALARAEASLSPPDATAFGAVLRRDAPQYTAAAKQFEAARIALGHEIVAQPYNPDAVRRALAAWQTSWNQLVDAVSGPLVDALGQVSPEGRQKLIDQRRRDQASFRGP